MTGAAHPVAQRWSAGEPAVFTSVMIPSTIVAETLQRSGPDGILLDMQHGHLDIQALPGLCQVVGMLGGTPFVRVPSADPWLIMRALDAGAFGIVVPLVNTRAEAEAIVEACFYPPVGGRSNGPIRPAVYGPTGDFHSTANATVLPFVMIETTEGMANLDDIFSVPGLAGVVIGPTDLGGSLGHGFVFDQDDPAMLDAYRTVVTAAAAHGLHAGIFTGSPAYSRRMVELGFDFVIMGGDLPSIAVSASSAMTAFRGTTTAAGGAYGTGA